MLTMSLLGDVATACLVALCPNQLGAFRRARVPGCNSDNGLQEQGEDRRGSHSALACVERRLCIGKVDRRQGVM